jgi:hypothetical protein
VGRLWAERSVMIEPIVGDQLGGRADVLGGDLVGLTSRLVASMLMSCEGGPTRDECT